MAALRGAGSEFFDTVVGPIRDINVPPAIQGYPCGQIELAGPFPGPAPMAQEGPGRAEFLDTVISRVRHEDMVLGIDGDTFGRIQLALSLSPASPLGQEFPRWAEFLDPEIVGIGDID